MLHLLLSLLFSPSSAFMTRFALFLFLSFVSLASLRAQDPGSVRYSPYEGFDLRTGDFSVVGRVGGRIYAYQASSDGHFLHAYDDSMAKMATVVLDFFPRRVASVRFVAYPQKMLVLYQEVEGRNFTQFAAVLDVEGRLQGEPANILSARQSGDDAAITTVVSDDRRTIACYSINKLDDRDQFMLRWLDDNLTGLGAQRITLSLDDNLRYGVPALSNAGTLYLPVLTPVGLKDFADAFYIARIRPDSNRAALEPFRLNSLFSATPFLKMDNAAGRVYISGFYSTKKNGHFEGVLFGYYDEAIASIQSRRPIAFDDRLREATGDRNRKRAFNAFDVRQLIVKNDGGFVMISEENYITTRHGYTPGWGYYSFYYSPFVSPSVREYHYDDILALSYDGEGNREWHSFVRKSQYSQEDGGIFSSYALVNTGSSLGFLFNDFNRARSTIQLATVDELGGVSVQAFASEVPGTPDWLPRSARQISARELVVPCLRRRQLCFARVVL